MLSVAASIIICIIGLAGLTLGLACAWQLRRWERHLTGVRVQVSYKGKAKMTPRLIDWLKWALSLEGDKRINGQVVYAQGGTTIALMKPAPREHGKTTTKTVKEKAA